MMIKLTEEAFSAAKKYQKDKDPDYFSKGRSDGYAAGGRRDATYIGQLGEWAFYQFLVENGIETSKPTGYQKNWRGDKGVDFTINHFNIDVKTNKKDILITADGPGSKTRQTDIYVLVNTTEEPDKFRIVGWNFADLIYTLDKVPAHPKLTFKNKRTNNYQVTQQDLFPIEILLEMLEGDQNFGAGK